MDRCQPRGVTSWLCNALRPSHPSISVFWEPLVDRPSSMSTNSHQVEGSLRSNISNLSIVVPHLGLQQQFLHYHQIRIRIYGACMRRGRTLQKIKLARGSTTNFGEKKKWRPKCVCSAREDLLDKVPEATAVRSVTYGQTTQQRRNCLQNLQRRFKES